MTRPIALEVCDVTKRFGGVTALDKVSFQLQRGEVHALLGENGAGKSTLLKILTGAHRPDAGHLIVDGARLDLMRPGDAQAAGIGFVPQDIVVVPRLSIGRNILLGTEGALTTGRLSRAELREVALAFGHIGLDIDPETPAGELGVPQLRLAQIARCLRAPGDVLLLDEPTAALSEPDAEKLLAILGHLRTEGKAIVYVTHRLSEVMKLADRATVLRDGRVAGSMCRPLDRARIVAAMAKPHSSTPPRRATTSEVSRRVALEAVGICVDRAVDDVSLEVREGTIVGIAGVQGAGHGPLLWALAQASSRRSGSVRVDGVALTAGGCTRAYDAGIVLVPADRRTAGIIPRASILENIVVSRRMADTASRLGLRRIEAEARSARQCIERFDVRPSDPSAPVGLLSGGNQQKVVLARAVASRPRVLLIEEPTQGVDIHAKAEIHRLLQKAAAETGCAIVVASSEFEELLAICSTIHVMRLGRLVHSFEDTTPSYRDVLAHAIP